MLHTSLIQFSDDGWGCIPSLLFDLRPNIPAEQLQILKHSAVKVLHSIYQQIWKIQQWPQDWKRSAFIPILEKGNVKECSNYCTIALISHPSKVMLKLLQARLQQYVNCDVLFKLVLGKVEELQIKLSTSAGSRKKQEISRKTSISVLLTIPKPLTVWITISSVTTGMRTPDLQILACLPNR